MINVLIVDDSATETALIKNIVEQAGDMHVVACAKNGEEAIRLVQTYKPDIITMDIEMPQMDGYQTTKMIMTHCPTPIVVISARSDSSQIDHTFLALDAGALSVLEKPLNISSNNFDVAKQRIIETIRSMSEIKVVKKRFHTAHHAHRQHLKLSAISKKENCELVAIGTSVGGPQALKTILSDLPGNFPVPIVIVQHMTVGFMSGFASWLNACSSLTVKEAEDNECLLPGYVYLAPDCYHLKINRSNGTLIAHFEDGPPCAGFRPSATVLLQSVAEKCGENAVGVLLTGMGHDGADGLLSLRKANGHTIIQDAKSTVVFGMAGVAQSLGAVDKVVKLDNMAEYLKNCVKQKMTILEP